MTSDDGDEPSEGRVLLIAVVTAACTTLAASLVTWAVDEFKAKWKAKEDETR